MRQSKYVKEGYEDREDYLKVLSKEYNIPLEKVTEIADRLGPSREFTVLVVHLQDLVDERFLSRKREEV